MREVSTLPIAPSMAALLSSNGFRYVSDLEQMRPIELSKELNISVEEANAVLETLGQGFSSAAGGSRGPDAAAQQVQTAKDLSMKTQGLKPIITFCRNIDTMLGGGIPLGQITEICGLPGIGKTQMATQLSLDVQIPKIFAGNEGETIYIDSEGSFLPERAAMMAAALSEHLTRLSCAKTKGNVGESDEHVRARAQEKIDCAARCTRDHLLSGIHVFRVHDMSELMSTLQLLPRFLEAKPKVKLVIVDSVAFHFRQELRDQQSRTRVVSQTSQLLNEVAYKNQLAVVVINHVTTSFGGGGGIGGAGAGAGTGAGAAGTRPSIIPALGEQWSHCITNRIMLSWGDRARGVRRAVLTKSPTKPQSSALFRVADAGIRDCPKEQGAGGGEGTGGHESGGLKRGGGGNEGGSEGGGGASKHHRVGGM